MDVQRPWNGRCDALFIFNLNDLGVELLFRDLGLSNLISLTMERKGFRLTSDSVTPSIPWSSVFRIKIVNIYHFSKLFWNGYSCLKNELGIKFSALKEIRIDAIVRKSFFGRQRPFLEPLTKLLLWLQLVHLTRISFGNLVLLAYRSVLLWIFCSFEAASVRKNSGLFCVSVPVRSEIEFSQTHCLTLTSLIIYLQLSL